MKKRSRKLTKSLSVGCVTLWLLSNGCAKIDIPDGEICGDAGPLGASCVTMLSGRERDLDKATWDRERFGQLCMRSEVYAEIKKSILKFCESQPKRCEKEVEKHAEEVEKKLALATKKARHGK